MIAKDVRIVGLSFALMYCCMFVAAQTPVASDAAQSVPNDNEQKQPPLNIDSKKSMAEGSLFRSRTPRYELCSSDVFEIAFPFSPEFNQTVTIQPDGFVTLLEIGDLYVLGKTVPELSEELTAAYSKILHKPVLNLTLKDFNRPYFTVGGEVGKPGRFELRSDITVTEAIATAGGFSSSARHSQVLLVRKVSNNWAEVRQVDVKAMLNNADMSEDIHLRSGDMLYVPKNTSSKVKPWIPVYGLNYTFNKW